MSSSVPTAAPASGRRLLAALVTALVLAIPVQADPFDSAHRLVRVYYASDGLPQNSVESIARDPLGRLWATTRNGAAVFDGTEWTVVSMPEESSNNWPRQTFATSDGAVWFSIEPDELVRLKDDSWKRWTSLDGLDGLTTDAIEWNGRFYVASARGIFSFDVAQPGKPQTEQTDVDVRAFAAHNETLFAFGRTGRILEKSDDGWHDLDSHLTTLVTSAIVFDDEVWLGSDNGVVRLEGMDARASGLTGMTIRSLAASIDAKGRTVLWATTKGQGVFIRTDGTWVSLDSVARMPNRFTFDLLAVPSTGPTAHMYVGSMSGLARLDLAGWRSVTVADGLPESSVVSVFESRLVTPGLYYAGTTGGMTTYENDRWVEHPCPALRDEPAFALLETDAETLWVGTESGLVQLGPDSCRRDPMDFGTAVVSLLETGTGDSTLWAGTYGDGLFLRGSSGAWRQFEHELPDLRVEALASSGKRSDQSIWIATNRGLVRFANDAVTTWNTKHGLPADLVRSIHVTSNADGESIIVGTAGGIAWASLETEISWHHVIPANDFALPNETIYRLEQDSKGRLYALTGKGMARFKARDSDDDPFEIETLFLAEDGLPSEETNFGASMIDSHGRLWVGTPRGLGILETGIEIEEEPSNLALSLRTADGVEFSSGAFLPFDDDRIVARFRLLDLAHGTRTVYRTEMVGLDDAPSDWSRSAERTFSKLPNGSYTFRLWAREIDGRVTGPVAITFSIQPPPWLSWWAVLIYVASAVVLAYTLLGLRIGSLRKRNEELELIVRSRTRDLEVANRQLESANETLADMSVTDPLTGARNRRYLLQMMEKEAVRVRRSTREADDVVFLLVDIDHFKFLNDRYGHATGDLVLKQFHKVLVSAVRDSDTIVRWGGEEFLVVARKISRDEASVLAGRILSYVRDERFESTDSAQRLRLTCSLGLASFPFVTWDRGLFTWEQAVDIADHCLYAIKRSGRDGWAGLTAGPQLRADSFLSRMRDDVATMAAAKEVIVTSSSDDPEKLNWR